MQGARIATRLEKEREMTRTQPLGVVLGWSVGQEKQRRGIALQPQPTWIREMGNANKIGTR